MEGVILMRGVVILFCVWIHTIAHAQLFINEIACNVPKSDWVELFLFSQTPISMDISLLYVTMYYGTNEPLSENPVTLYSYDRPETPWDDRFVVVHVTNATTPDECDATGDTNGNGVVDVYCNNYVNSLWNTDCVVAIDTDDDPSNGGIIDFVAYSNRDSSLNQSIYQYLLHAIQYGQWQGDGSESCMVAIGTSGLLEYQSIVRVSSVDNNSMNDFVVTSFQTPGRPNILPASHAKNEFVKLMNKTIVLQKNSVKPFSLFVLQPCSYRVRLFSSCGRKMYESPLISTVPGFSYLDWIQKVSGFKCGLYMGTVEAQDSTKRQHIDFYCIVVE